MFDALSAARIASTSMLIHPCACSLVTLRYIEGRLYLDPIRECYEAFVIYNFYMFLIAYLEVRVKLQTCSTISV